jgi:rSAM/selenodomain-associated transferase 2
VLDEALGIEACLRALSPLRTRGAEVIVVDGGSVDDTVARARPLCDGVLVSSRGRATQMNAGARAASGEALVFLHADSALPEDADRLIAAALERRTWGRFDVRISGAPAALAVVAALMNVRSRLTGIATGDQAIFVRRAAFEAVGGFPDIALMEDIALSRRLLAQGRPACLRAHARTSGRRWERHGVARTILLMWRLRYAYWRGADPAELARRYAPHPQGR